MDESLMCPNRNRCPMYPEFTSQAILRIFQRTYCDTAAHWKQCARYESASKGVPPPARLLPTGEMLSDVGRSPG